MSTWKLASLGTLSALALAACGGGGESGTGGTPAATQTAAFPVDTTTAATITGSVRFTGARPTLARIDMSEEATCAGKHPNGAVNENAVVNSNGTLANVFVYVKEGLSPSLTFPVPAEAVTINQDGCIYHPRVFGIQVGQTLNIQNSDGLLHNIKAVPTANRPFNISQPTNMTTTRTFTTPEIMVPLECNVHSWMNAFVGVTNHPYHATTGADGSFTIRRLPPGTYTIEIWHERFGTQTQQVTVGASESRTVDFTVRG